MNRLNQYSIRPLCLNDSEMILAWRNSKRIRHHMFSQKLIDIDEHTAWIEKMLLFKPERILIFQYKNEPIGLINLSKIDTTSKVCNWGFYLGSETSPKGSGTVLGILALNYGFNSLMIQKIVGVVLKSNKASINFHRKLGFKQEGLYKSLTDEDPQLSDIIMFGLTAGDWASMENGSQIILPEGDAICDKN